MSLPHLQPESSFSLRRAVLADAEAIAKVHDASRTEAFRGRLPTRFLDVMPLAERILRWQKWLVDPDAVTLVAVQAKGIVGFGTVAPSADDDADPLQVAEMPTLYVHPDYWRLGIGRALCDAVLDVARDRGYRTLTLWTLEANEPARAFYLSLGFVADGTTKVDTSAGAPGVLGLRFRLDLRAGTGAR